MRNSQLTAQHISERLHNAAQQSESVYLLIDRFSDFALQEAIESLPYADELCWPLSDELFKDNPQQSPLLVQLHRANLDHQKLLYSSLELAIEQATTSTRSICAWLVSTAQPQRLQSALSQRLTAHWPGNKAIYLRYFDPRVMPRLMQILPPEQQAQLLGPVQNWCQLGRDGQWITHSPPADLPSSPSSAHTYTYTHIHGPRPTASASAAAAIDRIELINLTAAALQQRGHAAPHSQDSAIDTALQAANKLGIKQDDDTIAYAWRAIVHTNAFTGHPGLPQLIAQASSTGLPLDTLLQEDLVLQTA